MVLTKALETLLAELPKINDESFRPRLQELTISTEKFIALHREQPKPSIAVDARSLLSAVRLFDVPFEDEDLETYTPTLHSLRQARATLSLELSEIVEIAEAAGATSLSEAVMPHGPGVIDKEPVSDALKNLDERLGRVERDLDSIRQFQFSSEGFVQQADLVSLYSSSMEGEVDLLRLQLGISDTQVDLISVTGIVETMSGLTTDFIATVVGWKGRVSSGLLDMTSSLRSSVLGMVNSVRTVVRMLVAKQDADAHSEKIDLTTPIGIGAMLRRRREEKNITIESIAKSLNINKYYVGRMEAGRFSELPGWTYAIGWVRTYAESVGLDPEPIILNLKKTFLAASRHSPKQ